MYIGLAVPLLKEATYDAGKLVVHVRERALLSCDLHEDLTIDHIAVLVHAQSTLRDVPMLRVLAPREYLLDVKLAAKARCIRRDTRRRQSNTDLCSSSLP